MKKLYILKPLNSTWCKYPCSLSGKLASQDSLNGFLVVLWSLYGTWLIIHIYVLFNFQKSDKRRCHQ